MLLRRRILFPMFVLLIVIGGSTFSFADSYTWNQANQVSGDQLNPGTTLSTGTSSFDIFVINLLAGISSASQLVPEIGLDYASGVFENGFQSDRINSIFQTVTFHIYSAGVSSAEIMNSLASGSHFVSSSVSNSGTVDGSRPGE
jgi:hypothetical protein